MKYLNQSGCGTNCCDPCGTYELEGCANGVPYAQLVSIGGSTTTTRWINLDTGDVVTSKPTGFLTGACGGTAANMLFLGTATDPNATDVTGGATLKDNMTYLVQDGTGSVIGMWKYDLETSQWYQVSVSVNPADLISADAGNILTTGSDDKLYVAETATTVTNTVTGHKIATYTNEVAAAVDINETVTSIGTITFDSATNTLTVPYTDETGTLVNHTVVLPVIASHSTSLTPVVYSGSAYVAAQANADANVADLMQLADGTRIESGKVTWTGHGLTVGSWYYLDQSAPGGYTATKPTSGIVQQLFFVEDANTIHVDIEQAETAGSGSGGTTVIAWTNVTSDPAATGNAAGPRFEYNTATGDKFFVDSSGVAKLIESGNLSGDIVYVNATGPSTATIFSLDNPPVTNDPALAGVAGNMYIGTDGSVWSYNGTTYVTKTFAFQGASDEFTATAGQTSFTLTGTPKGKVWMFRNGARLPNASFSVVGTMVTYVPANNGSAALGVLVAGDIIDIDYVK